MRTSASTKAPKRAAKKDVVMIHSATDDGEGYHVIRQRDDQLEVGTMRALKEGQPLHGEVVSLTPRPEAPFVCDVKVEVPAPKHASQNSDNPASAENTKKLSAMPEQVRLKNGPAQVASDTYRRGWDSIWGASSSASTRSRKRHNVN